MQFKIVIKKNFPKFLLLFNFLHLLIVFAPLYGQISLNYPKNRMVVQRNSLNKADIFIEGTLVSPANFVEARLITLDLAGLPVVPAEVSSWKTISSCLQVNNFSGAIFGQEAGWYSLEIRAIAGIDTITMAPIKVGIGEVFVVSGQSNACGIILNREPNNIYAPTDDRVNCINFFDNTTTAAPEMEFSHLDAQSFIAPQGVTAWCWGAFGQAVASNWNVPVLLFNTAIGNTGIFQWRASANEEADPCATSPGTCMPYYYLKKTLENYVPKTGVRAVLWHQGENDYGIFEGGSFPPEYYYSNIKQVIDKTRAQTGGNLSWVIAKVSRVDDHTSARVTNGQQLMIDEPNYNCYLGPLSDNIQPSAAARDNNHFWGQGLVDLGNSWFDSVNNANFINNSTPQPARFTITGFSAVKSGDWNDPTVWSTGQVPTLNDDVVICTNQIIILSGVGHLKSLQNNGSLELGVGAELKFGE